MLKSPIEYAAEIVALARRNERGFIMPIDVKQSLSRVVTYPGVSLEFFAALVIKCDEYIQRDAAEIEAARIK